MLTLQEDHIWKEMINTVNNLCYEKIREQIFLPNSQAQSVVSIAFDMILCTSDILNLIY